MPANLFSIFYEINIVALYTNIVNFGPIVKWRKDATGTFSLSVTLFYK